MKSYGKLLRLGEIFKRALADEESSTDSDVSDYSISSFDGMIFLLTVS